MDGHLFYTRSPLFVLIAVSLVLFGAAMIGSAIGRRQRDRVQDGSQIGTIQASLLGILGLLLGFTFAVASARYDTRRVLAIDEANALGTTFMRAQTLPEPYRSAISSDLSRYIDLRARASLPQSDEGQLAHYHKQALRLQNAIMKKAAAVGRAYQNDIVALFVESVNESVNLYATRIATYYARVPETILWILLCISIAALGMVGYGFGLTGQQGWIVMSLVAVVVAAVIVMIVDLDRPEAGPTRISQQTMLDLKNSISGYR